MAEDDILMRLKGLAEKATPAPWHASVVAGYILFGGEPQATFVTDARAWDARFMSELRNAWPTLLARIEAGERLAEALKAAETLFSLGERVPEEDPDIGAKVREIGVGLGFGAMMSSAQASWRKHLIAHGDPPGGEYAVVGCHAMVVKALEQARAALAAFAKAKESKNA